MVQALTAEQTEILTKEIIRVICRDFSSPDALPIMGQVQAEIVAEEILHSLGAPAPWEALRSKPQALH